MDVTFHNFRAALALVRKFLPNASFVSFDLEFTGLGESRPSQLDNPQTRYEDARVDVDDYVPIQFGLSIFCRQKSRWQVLPFNFNLAPGAVYYPKSSRYPLIDRKFTLQGSTVAFLLQHGFDFNKCLRSGVSWLSKNLEKELRDHVEADLRHRRGEGFKERNVDDDFQKLTAKLSERISEFMKEAESDPENLVKQITVIPLARSGVERGFTFHYIRTNYSRIVGRPEGTQLRLQLYRTEEEASVQREEALLSDVDGILARAVGFRYVIDCMLDVPVPLIVHNGLIDVTKLYGTFVGPLPEALQDFKRCFRKAFPVVYDTRLLVEQLASQDAAIQEAVIGKRLEISEMVSAVWDVMKSRGLVAEFETFVPTARVIDIGRLAQSHVASNEGFVMKEGEPWDEQKDRYGFGRYSDGYFVHEAGFDSLQTGVLFALISTILEKANEENNGLDSMEGKIILASCGGYQWVDFASPEEEVNRWFEKDVVIVSRESTGKGRLEAQSTLEKIFSGTTYETKRPNLIFAGPDAFIVVLDEETAVLSNDTFHDLETNAKKIGVEIRRYTEESLSRCTFVKNKKRKFSDQR